MYTLEMVQARMRELQELADRSRRIQAARARRPERGIRRRKAR